MENTHIVYAIVLSNFAQVILLFVLGLMFIRLISLVVKIPIKFLVPTILVCCVFGSYGVTGDIIGPIIVLAFGVLGWLMRLNGFPVAATVIGILLGRMAEGELMRSFQISGGEIEYFISRPITIVFLVALLLSLFGGRVLRQLR